MKRTVLLMLATAAMFPGCDRDSRWGASWPTEAERTMRDDRAPTPFTAEQIRAACPDGRRSTWLHMGPDEKPYHRVFSFRKADEEGVEVTIESLSLDGKPLNPARSSRAAWRALQSHAAYPLARTTVDRETLHLPGGWFHCMRYTVQTPDAPEGSYTRAWFAREIPGPPVCMEEYKAHELKFRMVLVRHEVAAPTAE